MVRQSQGLFAISDEERVSVQVPLAVRMRPRSLDDLVGQDEVLGAGSWLRSAIEADSISSVILFGPAGTGKTSLAQVIAESSESFFVEVSAVGGTVADLRREIASAQEQRMLFGKKTILFVDEIHRFNKSQQDALLHAVENADIILVGATTENPFFEVNTALISRSRVVELKALNDEAIKRILERALISPYGLAGEYVLDDDAADAIVNLSGGDGRSALTTLELAASLAVKDTLSGETSQITGSRDGKYNKFSGNENKEVRETFSKQSGSEKELRACNQATFEGNDDKAVSVDREIPVQRTQKRIALEQVQRAVPHRSLVYDKNRDTHYDVISAFIKSMRGSDPDAALYWLARMIEGGEDPKFIARRIFILASEDIGNADPQALLIAEAAFRAVEVIGLPECRINLAQAVTYMCLAPKSNAAVMGIDAAQREVRRGPARAVPYHLRDRHRPGSENYGAYLYPHEYDGAWIDQQYLPDGLKRGCFYTPSERGWEAFRMNTFPHNRPLSL